VVHSWSHHHSLNSDRQKNPGDRGSVISECTFQVCHSRGLDLDFLRGFLSLGLGREGGFDYSLMEGAGHLLQIEKPQECVRLTLEFLARCGLA
jgi:hypothetical protein